MTGRERITAVLNRQPTDHLCWTALCDETTRSAMPPEIREMPMLEFYRHLGCDIFQFGNFGLGSGARFTPPASRMMPDVETQVDVSADGTRTQTHRTPQGTLTATRIGYVARISFSTPAPTAHRCRWKRSTPCGTG